MGKTICIVSKKGGVGKTTTAVNLAASLAVMGYKTILVDCDPQGSATFGVGVTPKKGAKTLYDGLLGQANVEEIIMPTRVKNLGVIPAGENLYLSELRIPQRENKELCLAELLQDVKGQVDFTIIDTAASLGLLTINGLIAADSLLIPLQCEFMAYKALHMYLKNLLYIRKTFQLSLNMEGILLTMYNMGEDISHTIMHNARSHFKESVFETIIPRNLHLREFAWQRKPLIISENKGVGRESYIELAREILKKNQMI